MNSQSSPWNRPGAERLRTLLGGDPRSDTIITRVIESLDVNTLASFAELVVNMFSEAVRDGAKVGRLGALQAVQSVIDEVDGRRDDAAVQQLDADQRSGDQRRSDAAPGQFPDWLLDADTDRDQQ